MAGDLIERLRKRADQIGLILTDPPQVPLDAALMREAATALATEREAREKAEKETAEARAEVARYWTSADMKPWVDLAERKGLGHFGKKLKGMFSRAMKAEDDARIAFDRAEAAESSLAEAKRLLMPFADELKGNLSHHADDMRLVAGPNSYDLRFEFKLGDFRAAARFLAQEPNDAR